tara:strand:+ start:1127 stop:1708 length:582 start_codon:yes stop_codon:yes gene_type:complete
MSFKLKSYIYSRTAENKGIDNIPGIDVDSDSKLTSEYIIGNLEKLHNKCIDPIMRHFNNLPDSNGNSIGVTSVYRSKALNAAVKGVENSQHIQGMACDLIYTEGSTSEIYNWAIANIPTFNQIIWEFPEKGDFSSGNLNASWVHIAYNEEDNKKTKSLASDREDLHEYFKTPNTERRGQYTHGLENEADQTIV